MIGILIGVRVPARILVRALVGVPVRILVRVLIVVRALVGILLRGIHLLIFVHNFHLSLGQFPSYICSMAHFRKAMQGDEKL